MESEDDFIIKQEEVNDICEVSIIEDEEEEEIGNQQECTKSNLKIRDLKDLSTNSEVLDDIRSATGINISIEEWPGDCDFRIDRQSLSINEKEKATDATYSSMLEKLFCDINKCFSIRFILGNPSLYPYESLTIRAMVVYTAPGDMAMPVVRCPNHQAPEDPINQKIYDHHQIEHVIWSAENNAMYEKNECSGRLSVTTPFGLPHVGSSHVAHVYKFTCIGSCAGGINRRATSILFTLEHDNQVIGRQSLNCRICSCPKRDRKTQETSLMKQAMIHSADSLMPKSKKLKLESNSPKLQLSPVKMAMPTKGSSESLNDVYLVPVYGLENFTALCKFAEYLDSSSGALKNNQYRMHREQVLLDQQDVPLKVEPMK